MKEFTIENILTEGWLENYGENDLQLTPEEVNPIDISMWCGKNYEEYFRYESEFENIVDEAFEKFLNIQRIIISSLKNYVPTNNSLEYFLNTLRERLGYLLKLILISYSNDNSSSKRVWSRI